MQQLLDFESREGGVDRARTENAQGHCGDRVKVMGKGGAMCVGLPRAATALTHGRCTDSFISLGFTLHVDRVVLGSGGRTGTGARVGQSLEPEAVFSIHRDVQPLVPAPLEPLDVPLQLLGQEVIPADL